jgi:hypothetical protein
MLRQAGFVLVLGTKPGRRPHRLRADRLPWGWTSICTDGRVFFLSMTLSHEGRRRTSQSCDTVSMASDYTEDRNYGDLRTLTVGHSVLPVRVLR